MPVGLLETADFMQFHDGCPFFETGDKFNSVGAGFDDG